MVISFPAPIVERDPRGTMGSDAFSDAAIFDVVIREYRFIFEPVALEGGNYRLCVVMMPKCPHRRFDSTKKNTLYSGNHEYMWIEEGRLNSIKAIIYWANIFAAGVVQYIETGIEFTLPRDKDQ